MNKYVDYIMRDIGIPAHLDGYEAVRIVTELRFNDNKLGICKLYQLAAKQLDKSAQAVERNIRHLVTRMLTKGDMTKIINYFGASLPADGSLTNKQFIYTLAIAAKRIELEEDNNNVDNGR